LKKTTYLAIACFVLFLAAGVWYFVKDEPLPPKVPSTETTNSLPANVTFSGSSIVEERDGKRLWELSAENIEVDAASKQVTLHNLKGIFYQPSGGKLEMAALKGTLDATTKDIIMEGQIVATASDGARLEAAQLRYVSEQSRIFGSGGVAVTQQGTVLSGDNLESDTTLTKFKITGNAKVLRGGKAQ
jgi:LPS export ABC transporter protein LptC